MGARVATICSISAYRLGCKVANARSSNCHFTPWMPSRWANGA